METKVHTFTAKNVTQEKAGRPFCGAISKRVNCKAVEGNEPGWPEHGEPEGEPRGSKLVSRFNSLAHIFGARSPPNFLVVTQDFRGRASAAKRSRREEATAGNREKGRAAAGSNIFEMKLDHCWQRESRRTHLLPASSRWAAPAPRRSHNGETTDCR